MRKVISNLVLLIMVLVSCGLDKSDFTLDELVEYSESESGGMRQMNTISGIKYAAQYRPRELILATEGLTDSTASERAASLKKMYWFNIDIAIEGNTQSPMRYQLSSLEEYNARLDYFLNHAQRDIWILNNKDTIFPTAYWFENNHNLIAKETIVIGFEKEKLGIENFKLSFNDRVFKTGIVNFAFAKKHLDKKIVLKDR